MTRVPSRLPPPLTIPTLEDVRLVTKMALAGTLAWGACVLLGSPRPLFAVIVPLVAIGGDPFAAVNVSATRVVGVFAGVAIGIGLYRVDLPSTALIALLLAVTLPAGLRLRSSDAKPNVQVAVSALVMLYIGAVERAEAVAVARVWETAVGAAVSVCVAALVWPPDPLAEARRRVKRLRGWIDEDVLRAAELLAAPDAAAAERQLEAVRERSLQAVRDVFELERGEGALRWNPLHRGERAAFHEDRGRLGRAARQYRHLRTLTRSVADIAGQAAALPLPAAEREQLVAKIRSLGAAATDSLIRPPPVEPGELSDPRAIGLAVKLRQMADDLS